MSQLSIQDIEAYAFDKKAFELSEEDEKIIEKSYVFLKEFANDKIIYGINTGFGPMARYKIEKEDLQQLQYNLIRSHSSGVGNTLSEVYARSVVLVRLNNFLQGKSGVSMGVIRQLIDFLNRGIVPELHEHGGVGASGDLVQLAHLALNLIGEGHVYYKGERRKAEEVFNAAGLSPVELKMRDGLAIMNGTSCMTGIAAINLIYADRLFSWSVAASSVINEVIGSFNDSFSEELNATKRHEGQAAVAKSMRDFLAGSKMIRDRTELFEDDDELQRKEFKNKIQEYYSIRCVPQILGPVYDTLGYARKIVEQEINSSSDNPMVVEEKNNVFHGGNFHGDYISLEMDKIKISITKLSMLMDRQLNFLLNDRLNEKFPPFLNGEKLGFNFGFQGVQYTATSTTAENQSLSNPMYVHSIPNNNDNQDIVSMGTNSAVMAKKVIDNAFQVTAVHLMAVCQAIDLLKEEEKEKLSPKTKKLHEMIRQNADFVNKDDSQSGSIQLITDYIQENTIS